MKSTLLLVSAFLMFLSGPSAFAQNTTDLSPACKQTLIKAAIANKYKNLWLDYEVEEVAIDNNYGVAYVIGAMSDADADYWYSEKFFVTYDIKPDGSCNLESIKLVETVDDGDVELH